MLSSALVCFFFAHFHNFIILSLELVHSLFRHICVCFSFSNRRFSCSWEGSFAVTVSAVQYSYRKRERAPFPIVHLALHYPGCFALTQICQSRTLSQPQQYRRSGELLVTSSSGSGDLRPIGNLAGTWGKSNWESIQPVCVPCLRFLCSLWRIKSLFKVLGHMAYI